MKYDVEDRVKLNTDREYSDGTVIPAGRLGTVKKVYELAVAYKVKFDRVTDPKMVSERFLDPA